MSQDLAAGADGLMALLRGEDTDESEAAARTVWQAVLNLANRGSEG